MIQLNSFDAVRYRGIDGLSLPRLSKANLITGANGIGKTALIEAMWLFTGRYNPSLLWNANVLRSQNPTINPISQLTDHELKLRGTENGKCHELRFVFEKIEGSVPSDVAAGALDEGLKGLPPVVGLIRTHLDNTPVEEAYQGTHLTPSGVVLHQSPRLLVNRPNCVIESTRFQHETPSEYLQRYSDLVREGRKGELVRAINLLAEGIKEAEILTNDVGGSYLSVAIAGGKPRPLHDLGGGAVRLVRLLLGFSTARDGVFLSDELENGIHHSIQRKVWTKAREWMDEWNVQFVATTHSGEFVDAAIDAFADAPEDLSIHKLFRNQDTGQTEAATFSGESLTGARDLNLELR